MKIVIRSFVAKPYVVALIAAFSLIAVAQSTHAQNAVPPSSVALSSTKTSSAKSYNRALDADLIAAVLGNDIKKVRKLLGRNADPNAKSSDYIKTPALGSAVSAGNVEIARVLVDAGADLEGADAQGNVPLMFAALNDRAEAIRYLLQKGAKIEGTRTDNLTPLKTAATMGTNDALRALIVGGADVNTQKGGSLSPLMAASLMGNAETVRALVANGANVNARLASGATALTYAAANTKSGNLEIVKMLVEAGADVSVEVNGKTTNQIAADNKLRDINIYLVDIYNRDSDLFNLTTKAVIEMETATSSTRLARFQEFKDELAKGANPRFTSSGGSTTLINFLFPFNGLILTLPDNDPTMKTLIARSDLDAQETKTKATALHIAADFDNAKMVGWLIKAGANLNILEAEKRTPLDVAITQKRQNVLPLLKNAGAKTYAQLQNSSASTTSSTRSTPTPAYQATKADTALYSKMLSIYFAKQYGSKVEISDWKDVEKLLDEGATSRSAGGDGDTSLLILASDLPLVSDATAQKIVARADIDAQNNKGQSALHIAAENNYTKMVAWLIKAGANLNLLDKNNKTPMDIAVEKKNFALVQLRDTGAKTAAKLATTSTRSSTSSAALSQGKPLDIELHDAVMAIRIKQNTTKQKVLPSDWARVNKALDDGASGRYANKYGSTALTMSAEGLPGLDEATVKRIIAVSDVNAPRDLEKRTALHLATGNGDLLFVDLLLAAGADVNARDDYKSTPLDSAEAQKNAPLIARLRQAGAKTSDELNAAAKPKKTADTKSPDESKDSDDDDFFTDEDVAEALKPKPSLPPATSSTRSATPSVAAPKTDAIKTAALLKLLGAKTFDSLAAQKLMREGADANGADADGKTPLMLASEKGTLAAVEWMLSKTHVDAPKNVETNATDKNGMTALMHAANRADDDVAWRIVAELLGKDADYKLKNAAGQTAHDLAKAKSNGTTVMILEIEMEL